MPRPRTVQEALQHKFPTNNWSDFKPETPYSLLPVHEILRRQGVWELPWEERVDSQSVDTDRTTRLHSDKWNADVKCSVDGVEANVHDGVPFAYADGETLYPVYSRKNIFAPPVRVPMPNPVPRLGDPTGFMSDLQYFGIDRNGLWELSAFGPAWWRGFPFHMGADMAAEAIVQWLYSQNWFDFRTKSGQPLGMTGGKVPFLPMAVSLDEFDHGIEHALHLVILYGREEHVYPARSSDPFGVRRAGMPLRAGERLRFEVSDEELELRLERPLSNHERHTTKALREYGLIVDDVRPGPHGQVRMPMDHRVNVHLDLKLTDFVVLTPIPRR